MSLIAFTLNRDRAIVCVDTWGGNAERRQHVNKLFPVPHANMLVAGRGSGLLAVHIAHLCGAMASFDEAKLQLPAEARSGLANVRKLVSTVGCDTTAAYDGQEIYVFGFSQSQGEMVCLSMTSAPGETAFTVEDDLIELAAPGVSEPLPKYWDQNACMQVARRQVAQTRAEHPDPLIGGRLVMATLTRETIWIEQLGEIDAGQLPS